MATQVKPTKKDSPAIHRGANRDNLPADDYASRYKEAVPELNARANMSNSDTLDMSVGHISKSSGNETIKTNGITMRGHGAAIKGIKSRGPMA